MNHDLLLLSVVTKPKCSEDFLELRQREHHSKTLHISVRCLGFIMHLPLLVVLTLLFVVPDSCKKRTLSNYLNKSYPAQGGFLQKLQDLSVSKAFGKGLTKVFLKQDARR